MIQPPTIPPTNQPASEERAYRQIKALIEEQSQHGRWNHSPGQLGILYGLECAVAVLESRQPIYRPSPDRWLDEKENERLFTVFSNLMHLLARLTNLGVTGNSDTGHKVTMILPILEDAQNLHRTLAKLRRSAPISSPARRTLKIWHDEWPILADLGEGFYLVAHNIMPAIACTTQTEAGFDYMGDVATEHEDVPKAVRERAIRVLMQQLAASPTYPTAATAKEVKRS